MEQKITTRQPEDNPTSTAGDRKIQRAESTPVVPFLWHTTNSLQTVVKPQEKMTEMQQLIENTKVIPRIKGLKEIAGLHEIKKMLKIWVILPKLQPQLYSEQTICNSILLYGPPGTGKTTLVHALAAEAGLTLYNVQASDILSKYVGQTEK